MIQMNSYLQYLLHPNFQTNISIFPPIFPSHTVYPSIGNYGYVHPTEHPKIGPDIKEEPGRNMYKKFSIENLINERPTISNYSSSFPPTQPTQIRMPEKHWPLIPIPVRLVSSRSIASPEFHTLYRSSTEGIGTLRTDAQPDTNDHKRKSDDELSRPSRKKGVKHDRTTVDVYIREAKSVNDFFTNRTSRSW